jgi:hypothetical protein
MVIETGQWIKKNLLTIDGLRALSVSTLKAAGSMALLAVKILLVIGIGLAMYEIFNKLLWLFHELRYYFASIFGDEGSNDMKRFRQEIDLTQKTINSWSLEGIWDNMQKGLGDSADKAKEVGKAFHDADNIAKEMYDSLGDSLERAVNLPADIMPSLMQRMKDNAANVKAIGDASKSFRGAYLQTTANMPTPNLERAQTVTVKLDQKVSFDDFGEPIMKTLEGLGLR